MKHLKKRMILAALGMVCLTFTGCFTLFDSETGGSGGLAPRKYSGGSRSDEIIAYMNSTYPEDEFYYLKPQGGGQGVSETQILMTSKNFPEKEIWGYYSDNTERVYQYMDNYLIVKYQESAHKKFSELLDEIFAGTDYYYPAETGVIHMHTGHLGNLTFDEYMANDENQAGFGIIINIPAEEINQEELEQKIAEVFAENNISAGFGIEFAPDADLYNRFKNGEIVSWEYYDLIVKAQLTYLRFEGRIYSDRENEFTWRELHV
ncbi:MAG: hypothetical protein LBM41_05795 [Ruminococcus sp.]|jgi:hypothetical protein|nr:hypothetical protein [Ruminococcus sp.]